MTENVTVWMCYIAFPPSTTTVEREYYYLSFGRSCMYLHGRVEDTIVGPSTRIVCRFSFGIFFCAETPMVHHYTRALQCPPFINTGEHTQCYS
jgi:hypothetical protein